MTWLNIGCGPFPAPKPWTNTDVISIPRNVEPDVLVKTPWPLELTKHGIGRHSVERVYMGHVLEHVRWDRLPRFFKELKQLLVPGAQVCVVGPDVNRVIQGWARGEWSWEHVIGILEDDVHYQTVRADWDGARHCWNSYEGRIARLLEENGFTHVTPTPVDRDALAGWPVVDFASHQCAVAAIAP